MPTPAINLLTAYFESDGFISRALKSFEPRQQQEKMAEAVYAAITNEHHLIVEAGTGVGKSLAYLLPSALWAVQNQKKVVVATYTKALQEQLTKKDLPIIKGLLEKSGLPFKYFLLMGSTNYLCLSRLQRSDRQGAELFEDQESAQKVVSELLEWAKTAESGCRMEIPFRTPQNIWEEVCRDPDMCLGKRCALKDCCLYRKAVAQAKQADLIVVNQHLFFAGIPIPAFDAVIFDEAHNLEEVAANFLGFSVTDRKVKRLLDDIFSRKSGKGLAKRIKHPPANWLPAVKDAVSDAHFASKVFFDDILGKMGFDNSDGKIPARAKRVREPRIVPNTLSEPLLELIALLSDALGHSQSTTEEAEIRAHLNRCKSMAGHLTAFLECKGKDNAYWAEVAYSRRNPVASLNRAPVDVSTALRKELFEKHCPVILTSATLAADNSFEAIKSRLGLDKTAELLLDSPFDYEKQAVIFVPPGIPNPDEDGVYEDAVIKECLKIPSLVSGGIFVLCTSWRLLYKAFEALTGSSPGRPLLRQGEKLPQQLLTEFKHAGNGILLATDTFWQGIDVPGPALSCVVITRLPFTSPDTPLEEARHEWMAAKGMNVFNEYVLPKAIVKFRQGFGRLIRSKTDYGAVIILDPRIQTKRYGPRFMRSIPRCQRSDSLEAVREFFKTRSAIKGAAVPN